jgi:ligand-binding sensor domain-containing protein
MWFPAGSLGPEKYFFVTRNTYYTSNNYYSLGPDGFSQVLSFSPRDYINSYFGYDDARQNIWGQDPNGIFVINIKEQVKRHLDPGYLYTNSCFLSDLKGNIWLGTTEGVVIYSQSNIYFSQYLQGRDPAYSCRGFTEDLDGNIYGFTYNGNYIFHPETDKIEEWKATFGMIGLSICTDSSGHIWFGGENDEVNRYTPSSKSMRKWNIPLDGFLATWRIIPLRNGKIWVGTSRGLWIIDPNSNAPAKAYDPQNGDQVLNESTIYYMLETPEGVWLCTDNGLFLADTLSGIKTHINEKESGLPNNNLLNLHIDAKGIFWLASRGGGLIRWDRANNIFKSYTVNEGLSHNILYAVLEDDFGCRVTLDLCGLKKRQEIAAHFYHQKVFPMKNSTAAPTLKTVRDIFILVA